MCLILRKLKLTKGLYIRKILNMFYSYYLLFQNHVVKSEPKNVIS